MGVEYIRVPYQEKDEAKALGARWDREQRSWFVPKGVDPTLFFSLENPRRRRDVLLHCGWSPHVLEMQERNDSGGAWRPLWRTV